VTLRLEPASGDPDLSRFTPGQAVGSRYRLQRVIGRGRLGTVWLATDEVLERSVAVQLTESGTPGDLRRFTDAARSAAGLWHPNLVQIFDFGVSGERAFVVMEHLPGGSLQGRYERGEPSADERRGWACDLLSALRTCTLEACGMAAWMRPMCISMPMGEPT
jgi:serine/threonine protein kinase